MKEPGKTNYRSCHCWAQMFSKLLLQCHSIPNFMNVTQNTELLNFETLISQFFVNSLCFFSIWQKLGYFFAVSWKEIALSYVNLSPARHRKLVTFIFCWQRDVKHQIFHWKWTARPSLKCKMWVTSGRSEKLIILYVYTEIIFPKLQYWSKTINACV